MGFSPCCFSLGQVPEGRPWLVFVVAKNVRVELRILFLPASVPVLP
jgi:hypothetical protein